MFVPEYSSGRGNALAEGWFFVTLFSETAGSSRQTCAGRDDDPRASLGAAGVKPTEGSGANRTDVSLLMDGRS